MLMICLVCYLFFGLVAWLVVWSVGGSFGRLVDFSMVSRCLGDLVGWLGGWLVCWLISRLVGWLVCLVWYWLIIDLSLIQCQIQSLA